MFKINDYVVYGSTGVCQITDIKKDEHIDSDETEYYVLHPVYHNNITIKVPVNNPNSGMRAVLTKKDVLSLIAAMPESKPILIDNAKHRSDNFKAVLKTGNNEDLIKIIKTLYQEKKAKSFINKKLTKTDEDIMNTAEKQLYEEFAIALNILPEEVLPYILEHTPQNNEN